MQKVENGDFNWIIPGACHRISSHGLVYQKMGILLTSLLNECDCEAEVCVVDAQCAIYNVHAN